MATGAVKDGDLKFSYGMDSVSDPNSLPPEAYTFAVNMINRGGAMQTRPGNREMFRLPDGNLQGLKVFTPRFGPPVLLAFVDGVPYVSSHPFTSFKEVPGANMSASAKQISAEQATKSVERNADGSLRLITPKSLLMLNDGINPAAYYDGRIVTALRGPLSTPQGTHMVWAGSRLWVARREQVFASDIADPTSFIEQQFNTLGGTSYFVLPGRCTGLTKIPGVQLPQVVAFTDSTTSSFRSDILDRSLWSQTEQFQNLVFTNLGCVAPRSIVSISGMLWWYSDFGLTKLDTAQFSNISNRTDYLDTELIRSKAQLYSDVSGIASATFANFVLTSVPYANKRNRHTWVLDSSVTDKLNEDQMSLVWSSVWTGINPVEWTKIKINGKTRLFCASKDEDGHNRVYEAFTADRRDNNCDIPWLLETRGYTGGAIIRKHLRYLEYYLSELRGQVDLKISWAGTSRGRWKAFGSSRFIAHEGNVNATHEYDNNHPLFALKSQSRTRRTQDVRELEEDDLSSAGIDGTVQAVEADKENIDTSFMFRFEGSGPCAIRGFRVFMDPEAEPDSGMADKAEADEHFVRSDGAASKTEAPLIVADTAYQATKTGTARYRHFSADATATITSTISQADADKRASQVARERAERKLRTIAPEYVGGSLA